MEKMLKSKHLFFYFKFMEVLNYMVKILTKKILCCLLSLSLLFGLVTVPTYKVYAYTDDDLTFMQAKTDHWTDVLNTFAFVLSELKAGFVNGDFETVINNYAYWREINGMGELSWCNLSQDGALEVPESTIQNITNFIRQYQEDDGTFKSDSGLTGINYKLIHTSTYGELWENYYDSAKDYYSFAHFSDLDDFLTDFKNYYEFNPIPMAGDFKYKPKQPDFMVIVPSRFGCYFFCTSVMSEYYESDDNFWFYYLGSVDPDTGAWSVAPKLMDLTYDGYYCEYTGIVTFRYTGNGLNSPSQQPGAYIGSDQNNNSYKNFFAPDDSHIPQIGTPNGGYIKLFATDDDAKAYYNMTAGLNIPDYPYSGGNVYITNTNITYNNPDDPDDPDNPDSPDIPSGDDDNIWHDPSDDVPDAPFSGTVTEGIETIIKYLKKIYHQLILNNVLTGADLLNDIFNNYIKQAGEAVTEVATVAKNKFPFCIPGVIVTALTLTAVEAAPPTFEIPFKYERLGIDYTIEIDFTTDMWKGCRQVIWYFTLFLSIIGFVKLTILMTRSNN